MRILAIGDPHGAIDKIKKIPLLKTDLILITGDVGKADFARDRCFENRNRKMNGLEELEYTAKDLKKSWMEIFTSSIAVWKYTSRFAPTYSILGNVGMNMVDASRVKRDEIKYGIKLPYMRERMDKIRNFHFVRNTVRNIGGVRIGFLEYFSDICWFREFQSKDQKQIAKARKQTAKAKRILKNFNRIDILVCHQPPYGFLDKTDHPSAPKEWKGKHAGSKVILDFIKRERPKFVFCGHIHEAEGMVKIGRTEVYNLGVAGHKIISL